MCYTRGVSFSSRGAWIFALLSAVSPGLVWAQPSALKNFKTFSSAAGRFSVLMPGAPKAQVASQGLLKLHSFVSTSAGEVYFASYINLREGRTTPSSLESATPQRVIGLFAQGTTHNGHPVEQHTLTNQGYAARMMVYDTPKGQHAMTLLVYAKPFLYEVTTATRKQAGFKSRARAFFNSFRIIKSQ